MVCKKCDGFGYIQVDDGFNGMPRVIQCECVLNKALKVQAEKLGQTGLVPERVLPPRWQGQGESFYLSDRDMLRVHLRTAFANIKQPKPLSKGDRRPHSHVRMVGKLARSRTLAVADPTSKDTSKVYSLEDLVESHSRIVRLGANMARNSAMPEVLVETIEMRRTPQQGNVACRRAYKASRRRTLKLESYSSRHDSGWSKVRIETKVIQRSQPTETGKVTSNLGSHKRIKL